MPFKNKNPISKITMGEFEVSLFTTKAKKCPSCGVPISNAAKFCRKCNLKRPEWNGQRAFGIINQKTVENWER